MIVQPFSSTGLARTSTVWLSVLLSLVTLVQMAHADAVPSFSRDGTRSQSDAHTASTGRRNHTLPGAVPGNFPGFSPGISPGNQPPITEIGADESPVAETGNPGTDASVDVSVIPQGSVDINSATAMELAEALPGIGPSKSQAIVEWRERYGPFQSIEQLLEVSGIGPVTLANIRPFVRIGDALSTSLLELRRKSDEAAVIHSLSRVLDGVFGVRDTPPAAQSREH